MGVLVLGSTDAAAARTLLMTAYDDYSDDRNEIIAQALLAQKNPYAQTELAIYQMQQGQITQGMATYQAITNNMPLTAQELNEFAQGAALMRIIAAHYRTQIPRWDSLDSTETDTLRHVRDHTVAWAHTRACNWLSFAIGEHCGTSMPDMAELDPNSNTARRTNNDVLVGQAIEYLNITPNPSSNYFEVKYNLAADAQLRISDAVGRVIIAQQLPATQNKYRILATDWVGRSYLYEVFSLGKTMYYVKLIKQ